MTDLRFRILQLYNGVWLLVRFYLISNDQFSAQLFTTLTCQVMFLYKIQNFVKLPCFSLHVMRIV